MRKVLIGLFILISINLAAQNKMTADTTAVRSIDGIVKEVLRIISGEKGKIRNWEIFRSLFLPTANFTIVNHNDSLFSPSETVSLEEFITLLNDEYYDNGFLEYETGKVVEEYNGIAHVFQSFYAKDSEKHEERGITSYQLVYFNGRWWIANVVWTGNSNGANIPEKYLNNKKSFSQ
jgi:hypothetical protein